MPTFPTAHMYLNFFFCYTKDVATQHAATLCVKVGAVNLYFEVDGCNCRDKLTLVTKVGGFLTV